MVVVSQVMFGCSTIVQEYIKDGINGVFGLGPENISMARQLGNKFSNCIGDFFDPNYIYNRLILGDGANMDGYATPLEMSEAHYYLNLQGKDIGLNELDIDEGVFRRNVTDQSKLIGVIIDSGTPATWLIDQAHDRFRNEGRRTLARLVVEYMGECVYCFCFKGNMTQELLGFPNVICHFSDGADLQVGFNGIFYQHNSSIFCMAVFPSSQLPEEHFRYVTIIGVMAQQNYNVGYDLLAKKLYFQSIDCQLYVD
ncbi:aspartyl protease UND-like [Hevea brasiliensis]|nr:aspartyl protease UND-like [Hevea brasiliensis]